MSSLTLVKTNRRLGLAAGALLGLLGLGLVFVFAVLLPKVTEPDAAGLPDSLPGGWVAVDLATPPGGTTGSAGSTSTDSQQKATEYVRQIYDGVYDEPVAFRAYTDKTFSSFVVVTVFTSDGGAFGPANGLADPKALQLKRASTELVRRGDVVCVANYQPVGADENDTGQSAFPLGVSCQLPADGRTIQLASNGLGIDDTVDLVLEVADSIAG
ncbi:MAG: hypothetical protein QOD98_3238 [Nocardioidaceae bacterium]|nr:hypothetical protein [Nocardioidaceae bacterium]